MEIPDKLSFKRKEVIQLTKLEGRVLDYWEKEFGAFSPMVNQNGDQFYSRQDLEIILKIKHYLLVEKIDKEKVRELLNHPECGPAGAVSKETTFEKGTLRRIRDELEGILTILGKNDKK